MSAEAKLQAVRDYITSNELTSDSFQEISDIIDGPRQSGYDYENQAWVVDGKYLDCSHPQDMNCGCYSRLHAGETPTASVKIR